MTGRAPFLHLKFVVIVAISIGLSTLAFAVGLGPIKVDSYLGQPLSASIKVSGLSAAAAERTTVKLAAIADYESRGIEKLPSHDKLQFNVVKGGNAYLITVKSSTRIRQPFVNFLLTMNSDGASVTREYAVFLNPDPAQATGITSTPAPEMSPKQSVLTVTPAQATASKPLTSELVSVQAKAIVPVSDSEIQSINLSQVGSLSPKQVKPNIANEQLSTTSSQTLTLQPASATTPGWGGGKLDGAVPVTLSTSTNNNATAQQDLSTSNQDSVAYAGTYGPVKAGETLYSIALKTRPSDAVSVNQMMRAIFRANRRAFSSNNLNSLMAGYSLTIPDLQSIDTISASSSKSVTPQVSSVKPTTIIDGTKEERLSQNDEQTNHSVLSESVSSEEENMADNVSTNQLTPDTQASSNAMLDESAQETTANNAQTIAQAPTAEIAQSNLQTEDHSVNVDNEESQETDQTIEEVSPKLSSNLELDSPDTITYAEQAPNEPSPLEPTINADVNSREIGQTDEARVAIVTDEALADDETESSIDDKVAISGEDVAEANLSNTVTVDSDEEVVVKSQGDAQTTTSMVTNDARADHDTRSIVTDWLPTWLPKWLLGVFVVGIGLIIFLVVKIVKRKTSSDSEEEMSSEEIEDLMATLEEDEGLKKSLNFDELTENSSVQEQFDDISDTFIVDNHPSDENQKMDEPNFNDDFDKLAEEATKLGVLDDHALNLTIADQDRASIDSVEHHATDDDTTLDFNKEQFETLDSDDVLGGLDDSDDTSANIHDTYIVNSDEGLIDEDFLFEFDGIEEPISEKTSENKTSLQLDFSPNTEEQSTSAHSSLEDDNSANPQHAEILKQSITDNNDGELDESMEINLDLANAFIVTGNGERAKMWLEEVLEQGDDEQKAKARAMLNQISQS